MAALASCICAGLASRASAQCVGYTIAPGTAAFVAGTTDITNHCDDCSTPITLPFSFTIYGNTVTTANASSNGTLAFGSASAPFGNTCLPTAAFTPVTTPVIFPHWNDMRTDATGNGIFTATIGVTPTRTFVIEWRANFFDGTPGTANWCILLHEGTSDFDIVYNNIPASGAGATSGVQASSTGSFTQYSCNTATLTSGLSLHYTCVAPSTGACCDGAGVCTVIDSATCSAITTNTYVGANTVCTPNPCTALLGACCAGDGSCTSSTAVACPAGSLFQGAATVCTPNPCTALLGACCASCPSACILTTMPGCPTGSTFQGVASACVPSPCPQPPANDDCPGFMLLGSGGSATVNGTNINACNTVGAASSCGAGGAHDVWYEFVPDMTANYTASLCASTPAWDSVLSVHTACPGTALNQVSATSCNDDGCIAGVGLSAITTPFALTAGTHYWVRVAGYPFVIGGDQITGNFVLSLTGAAIGRCCSSTFTCSVTTQAACTGTSTWTTGLTCSTGCPQPTGQCCVAASGGCTITTQAACTAGTWNGAVTSCTPNTCPQPPQGRCCAPNGGCTVVSQFACANGTWDGTITSCIPNACVQPSGSCCAAGGVCTVVLGVDACVAGTFLVGGTCTPNICPVPPQACCDAGGCCTVVAPANCTGTVNASLTCTVNPCGTPPANDPCTGAAALTLGTPVVQSNCLATTDGPAGTCATGTAHSLWWSFVPAITGTYTASACGSSFDTVLTVFSGGCVTPTQIGCNDDSCGLQSQIATLALTAGQSYLIRVGSFGAGAGTVNLVVTPNSVCCRGATCNTTIATAAACTASLVAGQTAGASFPAGPACNVAGNTTSPCCYADYNKVNGVGVQDIFDFLADWFAGSTFANTGGDGGPAALAVQNIFDFLAAWFAGGC